MSWLSKLFGRSLYRAAEDGDTAAVARILDDGAEVSASGKDGMTALHAAAVNGRRETIELLLARGADVDTSTPEDITPTYLAAVSGFPDCVQLLLTHKPEKTAYALDVTSWQASDSLDRAGAVDAAAIRIMKMLLAYTYGEEDTPDDARALIDLVADHRKRARQ